MISIFRKLRKSLIKSGNTRKYLLYAIGEIALVVIGILIALQINNWNQSRLDLKSEKDYLERLVNDLIQDSIQIQEVLEIAETKIEAFNRLDGILQGNIGTDISFYENVLPITYMGWQVLEDRSRATFDELVSSGHLKLIRSSKLREDIGLYYQSWEHHYTRANGRKSALTPLLHKLIPIDYGEKDLTVKHFLDILEKTGKTQEFLLESQQERNYAHFVLYLFKMRLENERSVLKRKLVVAQSSNSSVKNSLNGSIE